MVAADMDFDRELDNLLERYRQLIDRSLDELMIDDIRRLVKDIEAKLRRTEH